MNIPVRPPCVNESGFMFAVNKEGSIRFGLGAIKGVGENAACAIIDERKANGPFQSVFDLTARVPYKLINKKTVEALAYAGALDVFGVDRARYFKSVGADGQTLVLDQVLQYGQKKQHEKTSNQVSMFGGGGAAGETIEPNIPYTDPWPLITRLNHERDVIGFYLSGHPLDRYKIAIDRYAVPLQALPERKERDKARKGIEVTIAGIITSAVEKTAKNGNKFGIFTIEDFTSSLEISLFGDDYPKLKGFFMVDNCVLMRGMYKPGFRDENVYEFKPNAVEQLDSALEKRVKKIFVDLPIGRIDERLLEELEKTMGLYKGVCPVVCKVYDEKLPVPLQLQINALYVKPEQELFDAFKQLNLNYALA